MASRVIQREQLEELVGPLSDAQWLFLRGSDLLRDAEEDSVSIEWCAAQTREVLGRPPREPAPGVSLRRDLGRRHVEVVSLLLAIDAGRRDDVRLFRGDALDGEVVPLDAVDGWIRARRDEPTLWVRAPVPAHRLKVRADGNARIEPRLLVSQVPLSSWEEVLLHYVDGHRVSHTVAVTAGGVLDELRVLSDTLGRAYGWTPAQATVFVLTDAVPLLEEVRVRTDRRDQPAASRIRLEVDPNVSPARVAEAYRQERQRLLVTAPRPLGEKARELARFVAESEPELTWRDRLDAWNAAHPDWAYRREHVQNFHRDATAARRRLLGGRLIDPPAGPVRSLPRDDEAVPKA